MRALKVERRHAERHRALDVHDLLRHHREHLEINAIELIEARPGAAAHDAFEKLAHGEEVKPVTAVEHDAVVGNGFC